MLLQKQIEPILKIQGRTLLNPLSILGFSTGRDSATFRDKGTEVPSLSRDKGTTGQAQNLATGRDGPGFFEAVPSRPGTSRGTKLPSILPINAVFKKFPLETQLTTKVDH